MYNHSQIQECLEEQLNYFSKGVGNDWKIETEMKISPPVNGGSRYIDVAVQTSQSNQEGYAFEIKTIKADRYRLHWQLRDYLIAGFQPILVAPKSLVEKTLPGKPVPIDWILDFLGVSLVVVEGDDQIGFKLEESHMTGDLIKICLKYFC